MEAAQCAVWTETERERERKEFTWNFDFCTKIEISRKIPDRYTHDHINKGHHTKEQSFSGIQIQPKKEETAY